MRKAITILVAACSLLVLAGAKSAKTTKPASTDSQKSVLITMGDDMRFSPAKIVIHRGETVAWQNMSHQPHNVVDVPDQSPKPGIMALPKGASTFDSGLVSYGQFFVQTFNVPGTYKYACTLHIANGMVGQIVVK